MVRDLVVVDFGITRPPPPLSFAIGIKFLSYFFLYGLDSGLSVSLFNDLPTPFPFFLSPSLSHQP